MKATTVCRLRFAWLADHPGPDVATEKRHDPWQHDGAAGRWAPSRSTTRETRDRQQRRALFSSTWNRNTYSLNVCFPLPSLKPLSSVRPPVGHDPQRVRAWSMNDRRPANSQQLPESPLGSSPTARAVAVKFPGILFRCHRHWRRGQRVQGRTTVPDRRRYDPLRAQLLALPGSKWPSVLRSCIMARRNITSHDAIGARLGMFAWSRGENIWRPLMIG